MDRKMERPRNWSGRRGENDIFERYSSRTVGPQLVAVASLYSDALSLHHA
jgi:hypothetical protein